VSRALLKRVKPNGRWAPLRRLGPALGNILLVVGLRFFAETAPLGARPKLWIEDAAYVLGAMIVVSIVRHALMTSIEWSAHRASPSETLRLGFLPMMRNIITVFVFSTGAIMILKHFG